MIVVYIILGLIALLSSFQRLLPKSYNVEKSTIINKSVADVMNRVGNLNLIANGTHGNKWTRCKINYYRNTENSRS